jgi:LAS superfamily LD-carboxypeptidase LdcB
VNAAELTGRTRTHLEAGAIEAAAPGAAAASAAAVSLHRHAAAPFARLRERAFAAGFELTAVSGFRDFERQLAIWNAKWSGAKPLFGPIGEILHAAALPAAQRIEAILHWSALPGASRHHWGTDLDLIDRRAVPAGYAVQLSAAEFAPGGPFAPLAAWLEENAPRFGFFRPYRGIRSGVQPEPWHFSFAPVAERARRALTPGLLREALDGAPLLGKEEVLARLDELHARYVAAIDLP